MDAAMPQLVGDMSAWMGTSGPPNPGSSQAGTNCAASKTVAKPLGGGGTKNAASMIVWESRMAGVKGEGPLWMKADIVEIGMSASGELKADVTVSRREYHGDSTEHNGPVQVHGG